MSEGVQYAGEYIIQEALLYSSNGEITDLNAVDLGIFEINIFEDIFRSSITGTIVVIDTRNIISKLPIMGQEYLSLKLSTPSLTEKNDIIDFTQNHFLVHKVTGRTEISTGSQTYQLHFISPEAIKNSRKRISKSYVKSKANIGEAVFDILAEDIKGIQTSKEVIIEETVGNRATIVTQSNPFSFVTRLSREAVSKNNGSPHYLFFENKHGFNFRTLQSLYSQDIRAEFHGGDMNLPEDRVDLDSGKEIQAYRRIIKYTINSKKDLLINSMSGMFGGKVIEHNIFNKKFKVKTFNYFDDEQFEAYDRIEDNRVYSTNIAGSLNNMQNEEVTNSRIHLIPISKDKNDFDANYELKGTPDRKYETLLDRQSRFVEILEGISINMEVHGQTTLAVGDMVNISLPTFGDDDDGDENKFYSGRYMIKRLRHRFANTSRMHTISMEVVKDGFPETINSLEDEVSKNSPTTQATII